MSTLDSTPIVYDYFFNQQLWPLKHFFLFCSKKMKQTMIRGISTVINSRNRIISPESNIYDWNTNVLRKIIYSMTVNFWTKSRIWTRKKVLSKIFLRDIKKTDVTGDIVTVSDRSLQSPNTLWWDIKWTQALCITGSSTAMLLTM